MSRTFRDAVQMDRERRDPREPFIPDAAACEDWEEYAAYLDGGVLAVEQRQVDLANLELSEISDSLQRLTGQVESHYQRRETYPNRVVVTSVDEVENVDQLIVVEPCTINVHELRELLS